MLYETGRYWWRLAYLNTIDSKITAHRWIQGKIGEALGIRCYKPRVYDLTPCVEFLVPTISGAQIRGNQREVQK